MATYAKNTGADLDENVQIRLADLERQVAGLSANRLVTLDRFRLPHYPAPVEGQVAVDSKDNQHAWYANGAWRKALGGPRIDVNPFYWTITGSRLTLESESVHVGPNAWTLKVDGLALDNPQEPVYIGTSNAAGAGFQVNYDIVFYLPEQGAALNFGSVQRDTSGFVKLQVATYDPATYGPASGTGFHDCYITPSGGLLAQFGLELVSGTPARFQPQQGACAIIPDANADAGGKGTTMGPDCIFVGAGVGPHVARISYLSPGSRNGGSDLDIYYAQMGTPFTYFWTPTPVQQIIPSRAHGDVIL